MMIARLQESTYGYALVGIDCGVAEQMTNAQPPAYHDASKFVRSTRPKRVAPEAPADGAKIHPALSNGPPPASKPLTMDEAGTDRLLRPTEKERSREEKKGSSQPIYYSER
uniref:Uncharacterized protein n=1 Tax=Plectus sambesii TaxID=2011161 RepID=A0A914X5F2_9BILA